MSRQMDWNKTNPDRYRSTSRASHKRSRERNVAIVLAIKEGKPCADCGLTFPPYVMDFDHPDDNKHDNVSRMANTTVSVKRLLDEIAKCVLVCSNCHRIRTHNRLVLRDRRRNK